MLCVSLCLEKCDMWILENHLDTGNHEKTNCPTAPGSTCTIPSANHGSIIFECEAGRWVISGR